MKIPDSLRAAMLNVIKNDILAGTKKIQFYDDSAVKLAEFDFLAIDTFTAEQTYLLIKRLTTSTNSDLISAVDTSGTVTNFIIPTNAYGNITGTVGAIGTSTDIQFTSTTWVADAVIRISNIKMILEQGS